MVATERKPNLRAVEVQSNRALIREGDRERERRRLDHEREAVIRLSYRAARNGAVFALLRLDYRYWQLRACGWDVLATNVDGSSVWAHNADGKACDPEESTVWQWWRGLHWRERNRVRVLSLADRSQQRAERRRKAGG